MRIQGAYDPDTWFGVVTIDDVPLSPARSLKVSNHSPDGFSWGYAGSGPAQLALAVLLAAGYDDRQALSLYQRFKVEFIQRLPREKFVLIVDVDAWAAKQMAIDFERHRTLDPHCTCNDCIDHHANMMETE